MDISYAQFYCQQEDICNDSSPNKHEKIARYQMYLETTRHNKVIEDYLRRGINSIERVEESLKEIEKNMDTIRYVVSKNDPSSYDS